MKEAQDYIDSQYQRIFEGLQAGKTLAELGPEAQEIMTAKVRMEKVVPKA